jgi:hypothetical protein
MWYKVSLESGVEGWVLGQFIEVNYGIDSPKNPAVVIGGTWILAQPKNDAPQIEEIQGGEVVEVSRNARDEHNATWSYIGKGWVANEFLLRPTCLRFNGNPLMVVEVGGTAAMEKPNRQAQVAARLDGGNVFFPQRKLTNNDGTWFQMEKGWVDGKALFYPTCQDPSDRGVSPAVKE